jgi:hypothetical protein
LYAAVLSLALDPLLALEQAALEPGQPILELVTPLPLRSKLAAECPALFMSCSFELVEPLPLLTRPHFEMQGGSGHGHALLVHVELGFKLNLELCDRSPERGL